MQRPYFSSPQAYGAVFTSVEYWQPYVKFVCVRHHLGSCEQIRPGRPGTNPVFIVDELYVIKFYTDLFNGAQSYPIELEIYTLFAQTPHLPLPVYITHGNLFSEDEGWSWPYIVIHVVPGTSLGEVYNSVIFEEKIQLASDLGYMVCCLHTLSLEHSRFLQPTWDAFIHFLEEQRKACVENHKKWKGLSDQLIAQIDSYLPPLTTLIDRHSTPSLLHCDLNEDHVMGYIIDGQWHTTGIIDFGDAKVGHRLYELVALHIGLFHCNKRLLRVFLENYDVGIHLNEQFVGHVMCFTLLHEFGVLQSVSASFPRMSEIESLTELATLLWDLDKPGFSEIETNNTTY